MPPPTRTAKRIYSPSALEFWFRRIDQDWEPLFSKAALRRGRELYRDGEIREIELGPDDAIIHFKFGKQSCYAMVEWNGDFHVRGSLEDAESNASMAAAGLYEIEELLADEISPVPPERPDTHGGAKPEPDKVEEAKQVAAPDRISRELILCFSGRESGLSVRGHWKNGKEPHGNSKSEKGTNGEDSPLTEGERESMIRLTTLAKRSGFEYRPNRGDFILKEFKQIIPFLKSELTGWESHFATRFDEAANLLKKGIQSVSLEGKAENSRKDMAIQWKLRVDGLDLDEEQSLRLLKRGRGLTLLPRVGLVRLSDEQADAIDEWKAFQHGGESGEWPKYMLFSLFAEPFSRLRLEKTLKEWHGAVTKGKAGKMIAPSFLRPYQEDGVKWLAHLCDLNCHPLLADEMGLGKTLQILSLFHSRKLKGDSGKRPHLIVCPASVVPVWQNEIHRFFPEMKVAVLKTHHDFEQVRLRPGNVWISSYTQLRRHRNQLDHIQFGYAVLDEAQHIKNPDAKVSQACVHIQAEHRLALTGTPLENRHLDLWALFRFLMPGLLGNRRRFELAVNGDDREAFIRRLERQVRPFILRRTKSGVMKELPPKVEMDLACPLTDLQVREYRRLSETGVEQLGEDLEAALQERSLSFFTLLTRLRQVCCDPGLLPWESCDVANSGKINALLGRMEEILDSGSKVVIFSQFTSLLKRVRSALRDNFPELAVYQLTGKTLDRDRPVRSFQEKEGSGVILVSLRAGGVGITLHAADYVFLMDPWWNPAVEAQAIDRVHRIGQEKRVFVYRMITTGTVEDRIQALKADKNEMFQRILGDMTGVRDIQASFKSLSSLIQLEVEGDS